MNPGNASSSITDFTKDKLSDEVYFSALKSQGDRQLFKLDKSLSSTHLHSETSNAKLKVFPVPSNKYIRLDTNFKNISIMTINGQLVSKLGPYIAGEQIPIVYLDDGIYLLYALSHDNQITVGKFIIQKE